MLPPHKDIGKKNNRRYGTGIQEPGNDFSFGALIFFKNGDIEFNWLRGKEGGNAECKDFSWE